MSLIDAIAEALTVVQDPELRRSITDLGMVEDLNEVNGDVSVSILLTISDVLCKIDCEPTLLVQLALLAA